MRINKKKIVSVGIIICAITFGFTTKTGLSIGNEVFKNLGIASWSNGYSGFFYPGILSILLLILGFIYSNRYFGYRKTIGIIIVTFVLAPILLNFSEITYLKNSNGLRAVLYERKESNMKIETTVDNENILINGDIKLVNYGKSSLSFEMKVKPDARDKKDDNEWFFQNVQLYSKDGEQSISRFTIEPGESKEFKVFSELPNINRFSNLKGSLNGPDLEIYNLEETKEFTKY